MVPETRKPSFDGEDDRLRSIWSSSGRAGASSPSGSKQTLRLTETRQFATRVVDAAVSIDLTLELAGRAPQVHLLPGFDEYLLGYGDRTAALAPEHSDAIVPGSNGMFKPTIVVDGEVLGTCRRTIKAREVVIEPALFGRLSAGVRELLAEAAQGYGAFIGRAVRLVG